MQKKKIQGMNLLRKAIKGRNLKKISQYFSNNIIFTFITRQYIFLTRPLFFSFSNTIIFYLVVNNKKKKKNV